MRIPSFDNVKSVGVVLAVAGVAFVGYKVYKTFAGKSAAELIDSAATVVDQRSNDASLLGGAQTWFADITRRIDDAVTPSTGVTDFTPFPVRK